MNAKDYRKNKVATRHFTVPVRPAHLAACLAWQEKFAFLCRIMGEVKPKVTPEILPGVEPLAVRFARGAYIRKNEKVAASGEEWGEAASVHSIGAQDVTDENYALAASLRNESASVELV